MKQLPLYKYFIVVTENMNSNKNDFQSSVIGAIFLLFSVNNKKKKRKIILKIKHLHQSRKKCLSIIWYSYWSTYPTHGSPWLFSECLWTLSVHSYVHTWLHAHTFNWFLSFPPFTSSLPNQEKHWDGDFSICTRACVTNAAASEKQPIQYFCPCIASSLSCGI